MHRFSMKGLRVKVVFLCVSSRFFLNSIIGAVVESESPLPDFVPNTHPSEPSLPVTPEKVPAESNHIHRKSPSPSPPPMLYGLPIPPPPSKVCTSPFRLVIESDLFRPLFVVLGPRRQRVLQKNLSCPTSRGRPRGKI